MTAPNTISKTGEVTTALVLVHDAVPGRGEQEVGTIGPALTELGFTVVLGTLLPGGPPVPDPAYVDVIVVLGWGGSAYDDSVDWLAAELDLLARAIGHGTPVLGICFGAQALARVLGGAVGRAPRPERGFVPLDSRDHTALPSGVWMQFHDDAFTLPAGAEPLARNGVGLQAFVCGPHLAVQFHPEITPEVFDAWAVSEPDSGASVAELRAEIVARAEASTAACRALITAFCARAGLLSTA